MFEPKDSADPIGADPVVAFSIGFTRFLNEAGELQHPLPEFARDPASLIAHYTAMVKTRVFDNRAVALQRTGQMGTYASSLGQEAIGVALGMAMAHEDVLLGSYREYAAQFLRGVPMSAILNYWGGDERGMDYPEARDDFPICVPISTQVCHGVGVATAFKLRGEARVAVCVCGDGATSKGDFYEAINLAGAWNLPVVFVVNNNGWAISVPRSAQSGAATLAQKAIAAGFSGEQVDGNDVIALQAVLSAALDKARCGASGSGGPTLIEALTYRLCDHTTADDASRYRPQEELDAAWAREPIARLQRYLISQGVWDDPQESALTARCEAEVEVAVQDYLAITTEGPESMFDHLYESLPTTLAVQRRDALQYGEPRSEGDGSGEDK